ncbi:MAG: hypothetical protein QM630_01890 [Microbacterium sp.]
MPVPEVAVTGPGRVPILWITAGVLFVVSAAMLAIRSMPSNMAGTALMSVHWMLISSFALACIFSAAAIWPPQEHSAIVLRTASVTTGVFGLWVFFSPLVLSLLAADMTLLVDALVRIVIGGTAVSCLSRSSLAHPWRAIPAITFGVVALAALLAQAFLTSNATMDLAVLANNLLVLIQVAASVVIGVVALKFARLPRPSTPII